MNECMGVSTSIEIKLILFEDKQITTIFYRELIGCVMYIITHSMLDIFYAVSFLSRGQSKLTNTHWVYLKRILWYLKDICDLCLTFLRLNFGILIDFCDADFRGDLKGRKSTTGYLFKVLCSAMDWCNIKQTTVALTKREAKYVGLSATVSECL